MASITIYESHLDAPFLPATSLFEYLLPDDPAISPLPAFDPSLPAFIDGASSHTLSRGYLRASALRLAAGLRGKSLGGIGDGLGLRCGDVACIWSLNSLQWVVAAYGCFAAGVTLSPANAAYAPAELAHQVNDSGATVMFVSPALLSAFEQARPHFKYAFPPSRVVLLCPPDQVNAHHRKAGYRCLEDILAPSPGRAQSLDGADAQTTALLCYSSGTTGKPKGVMTSHWNLTSQLQAANLVYQRLESGVDVVMGFLPFSHIYGVTVSLLQPLSFGCPVVVLPKFDEVGVLAAVERFRITHILMVPPLFLVFLHSKHVQKFDISSIRTVMSGAAPLSKELSDAFLKLVPNAVVIQGFGMTETTPNICTMSRADAVGRQGWVGRLIPTYQARLVRPEDGSDAQIGQPGELWVRGPSVMKGYHNNPEATADAIARGGWMKTGDVVVRDPEGWFKVVDRLKELIKYKGFQVAPAELEALLIQHPGVVDAGVVGVYDLSKATELPRAYIVAAEHVDISTPERNSSFGRSVAAWLAGRVAGHKQLRGGVVLVERVPKSPTGKILRKVLRERAQKEKDSEGLGARL